MAADVEVVYCGIWAVYVCNMGFIYENYFADKSNLNWSV